MGHPYETLPEKAFWRTAIAEKSIPQIEDLWTPKFRITRTDPIVAAGSCFAQHLSRKLVESGFNWLNAEPAPPGLSPEEAAAANYGVFSFRTGNIYTPCLLRQWVEWAFAETDPSEDLEIWEIEGGVIDPFRPAIEPAPFASREELVALRRQTLAAIRSALSDCSVFVFTLGLAEAWRNTGTGLTYPMCPGTVAGRFDPDLHRLKVLTSTEVREDMERVLAILRQHNPGIRVLLTVSPVPLTATATGDHVLVATIHAKSLLRTVAGELRNAHDDVDYFPSYEIISTHPFRGRFFEANLRSVAPQGVRTVMRHFFAGLAGRPAGAAAPATAQPAAPPAAAAAAGEEEVDLVCEEMALDAFAKSPR